MLSSDPADVTRLARSAFGSQFSDLPLLDHAESASSEDFRSLPAKMRDMAVPKKRRKKFVERCFPCLPVEQEGEDEAYRAAEIELVERSRADGDSVKHHLGWTNVDIKMHTPLRRAVRDRAKARQAVGRKFIETEAANLIFGVIIIANAIFLGVDIELTRAICQWADPLDEDQLLDSARALKCVEPSMTIAIPWQYWIMYAFKNVFLLIFIFELTLRFRAFGVLPVLRDPMGAFDCAIVISGMCDVWYLAPKSWHDWDNDTQFTYAFQLVTVLRLLRLGRIIRLLRFAPKLLLIIRCLGKSLEAAGLVFGVIFLLIYTGALMSNMMLRPTASDPLYLFFGTVSRSLLTHFQILTLDSWHEVTHLFLKERDDGWFWVLYVCVYILITSFSLMNIATGVIVDIVMDATRDSELDNSQDVALFTTMIQECLSRADADSNDDGLIDIEEFARIFRDPTLLKAFNALDIATDIDLEQWLHLFHEADQQGGGTGKLSFGEVMRAIMRWRGSKGQFHSVMVQQDVRRCQQWVGEQVELSEQHLTGVLQTQLRSVRQSFDAGLREVTESFRDTVADLREEMHQSMDKRFAELISRIPPHLLDDVVDPD
mmetsp:Transcript_28676/g.65044  ORF Transcript_28676/g.65044 Transcript_28676/m.65044 type:complete len:600 (+) Transcript_28676:1-1800(+)